jgi:hypothetical protein
MKYEIKRRQEYPCKRQWRSTGTRDVEASIPYWQCVHRWRWGRPYAPVVLCTPDDRGYTERYTVALWQTSSRYEQRSVSGSPWTDRRCPVRRLVSVIRVLQKRDKWGAQKQGARRSRHHCTQINDVTDVSNSRSYGHARSYAEIGRRKEEKKERMWREGKGKQEGRRSWKRKNRYVCI